MSLSLYCVHKVCSKLLLFRLFTTLFASGVAVMAASPRSYHFFNITPSDYSGSNTALRLFSERYSIIWTKKINSADLNTRIHYKGFLKYKRKLPTTFTWSTYHVLWIIWAVVQNCNICAEVLFPTCRVLHLPQTICFLKLSFGSLRLLQCMI